MRYHLVGIKGSGMAGLAQILHDQGNTVQGSDVTHYVFTQDTLKKKNIDVLPFNLVDMKTIDVVIVGHSFFPWHEEVQQAYQNNLPVYEYHEFLGSLSDYRPTIAIAGSHGKTTTTGWIASTLSSFKKIDYLIGDGTAKAYPSSDWFVFEACEYQRHFLKYHPTISVILNVDLDHTDYFSSLEDYQDAFQTFIDQTSQLVVMNGDDSWTQKAIVSPQKLITFGIHSESDIMAKNITQTSDGTKFDVFDRKQFLGTINSPYFGEPMILNALATITISRVAKLSFQETIFGMEQFAGTKRRFQETLIGDDVVIDDYAHHPTQMRAVIERARLQYPSSLVVAIYQPDRYSRLWSFYVDIANALSLADYSFIVPFPVTSKNDTSHDFSIDIVAKVTPKVHVLESEVEWAMIQKLPSETVFLLMSSKDLTKLKIRLKNLRDKAFDKGRKNV